MTGGDGLRVGAPVLFNGIRVGDVSDLRLTNNPSEVAAVVTVEPATPVRRDTTVSLDYAGLTGIASVSLRVLASSQPLEVERRRVADLARPLKRRWRYVDRSARDARQG